MQLQMRVLYNMSSILNSSNKLCWVRQLEIRLSSKLTKKKIVFGGKDSNQLDIKINRTLPH